LIRLTGTDIVAIVAIVCFTFLVYTGHDSFLITLIATIIGWYFGRKRPEQNTQASRKGSDT